MISCRLVQERAGYFPICATLAGMLRDLRLVQPVKASIPMRSRPAGRTTFSRLVQNRNCSNSTALEPFSKYTSFRPVHLEKAEPPPSVRLAGMVRVLRLLQPAKANQPRVFRFLGRVISDRAVHLSKAEAPMSVTLSGI